VKSSEVIGKSNYSLIDVQIFSVNKEQWWTTFNDDQLNALITEVLKNNQDLNIAQINIEKVNELVSLNEKSNQPQAELNGIAQKQQLSEHGFYPSPLGGSIIEFGQLSLKGNLHLDFFGKNSSLLQEKKYQKEAISLNKEALELALSIQTVKLYGYWQYLNTQDNLIDEQIKNQEKLVQLAKAKLANGLTKVDEVLNMQNGLDALKNAQLDITTNKKTTLDQLSKLVGKTDNHIVLDGKEFLTNFEKVLPPQSISSSVVVNKPEVKYYLFNILAQEEKIKSLKADFYPSFALTGEVGLQKIGFSNFLNTSNLFANIGPAVNLPILDAGRISSNYKIAGMDLNIFVENYNKAVVNSYYDLNSQLFTTKQTYQSMSNQDKIFKNNTKQFILIKSAHDLGKVSFYEKIQKENDYLNQKKQNINTHFMYFNSQVDLINSMGGIAKNN
jgi:NodT family efflux transporter outer membrane factor (OMF) lipoprotein